MDKTVITKLSTSHLIQHDIQRLITYLLFLVNCRALQGLYLTFCFYTNLLQFNMVSLKTVKKWEETLKCELGKETDGNKVTEIKRKVCIKYKNNTVFKLDKQNRFTKHSEHSEEKGIFWICESFYEKCEEF